MTAKNISRERAVFSQKSTARLMNELNNTSVLMIAGYALCQLWLSLCFFAPQLFPENSSVFVYELSLAVCVCCLIPCLIFPKQSETFLEKKMTPGILSICGGVGTLLIPLSAGDSITAISMQIAAGILTGLPSGWLFVGWYQAFCKLDDLAGFVIGVVVSSLFMYILTSVAFIPSLSPWIMVCVASITPVVSGIMLIRCSKSPHYVSESNFPPKGTEQRHGLLLLCCGIFAVSLVDEFMRNYYLEGSDLLFYSGSLNLVLLLVKILCTAILVSMLADQSHHMSFVYRVSFLLTMIAVLFMPYVEHMPDLGYGVTNFGAFLFKIMVMIFAFNFCQRYRTIPILVFALTRMSFSLDLLIGFGAFHAYKTFESTIPDLLGLISVSLGILIVATYLFVFTNKVNVPVFLKVSSRSVAGSEQQEVCQRLVRVGRLSKREAEVLELIVKGRSTPRIQEELCLSMNTVNTHISHIYQKLQIHSRQELLDLVEETAPEEGTEKFKK